MHRWAVQLEKPSSDRSADKEQLLKFLTLFVLISVNSYSGSSWNILKSDKRWGSKLLHSSLDVTSFILNAIMKG